MTTRQLTLGLALALALLTAWTPPVSAEHNTAPPVASPGVPPGASPSPLDLDVKLRVDRDRFTLSGKLSGLAGLYETWLSGRLRRDGFSLDGRVQDPARAWNFRLDAEVPEWLLR
jgi:hypothetical protein